MDTDWWLYIISTESGLLYTGITKDLLRRFKQHSGKGPGAKFFRTSPPKEVVFTTGGLTHSEALKLERRVKKLNRDSKLKLIQSLDIRSLDT